MKNNILIVCAVAATFFSTSVFAEYYDSEPASSCGGTTYVKKVYYPRIHRIRPRCAGCCYRSSYSSCGTRYIAPRRNYYRVTQTTYYSTPSCGCSSYYVPGGCRCGRYVPGHYETERDFVTFVPGPSYTFSGSSYSPGYYVNDRATADDYGATLQIN